MRSLGSRELIALLEREGWRLVRVKGSHHQYRHPTRPGLVTVPHPKRDLPVGTVKSILSASGLKLDKR